MDEIINWGIIGLGNIANKFAEDLNIFDGAILYGVASRDESKAILFKKKHKAVKHFSSYESLVRCKDIDVIYVATPHSFHYEHTMLSLRNNKHVLCEKAFAINSVQVEDMIREARERNLFLMEALWSMFIPTTIKTLELLNSGIIGDIKTIKSGFGFIAETRNRNRLTDNKLGGGTLLDIGIYPAFMSLLLLGMPKNIEAKAILEKEIDTTLNGILSYDKSKAIIESSFIKDIPFEVYIIGEKGSIKIHSPFDNKKLLTLSEKDKPNTVFDFKFKGNGYYYEIEEVTKCINNGFTESNSLSLSFSLKLMNILDSIRAKVGLKYNEDI